MDISPSRPLADSVRPDSLDDVVGQRHILGEGKVLRSIIEEGRAVNMIFYGPSGTGKTTVARIIAKNTRRTLHRLNATTASIADIRAIIDETDTLLAPEGVLLYLDEIQYFNKKQQQSLLEFLETGKISMIASTTENPYFYVYNAVLSRCTVFEFRPLMKEEVEKALSRAAGLAEKSLGAPVRWGDGVMSHIAASCGGDVRKAINAVELLLAAAPFVDGGYVISMDGAKEVSQRSAMRYDRDADDHYDVLSALQKSIRGSDPDAALHYTARLIEAGDLLSLCRRVLVCACEDIGLAYPSVIPIVKACVDSALQLGLPEGRIPMADAVILLCTSPKSNSGIVGIDAALDDIRSGRGGEVPDHLKDGHYAGAQSLGRSVGYKYPHSYENSYVSQQYLPDNLKEARYYLPGDNKTERQSRDYWQAVKERAKKEKE